jgi:glycosyltransferase involved in cell wall biosynthesis
MKILVAHTFYQQPGGEDTVFAQEVQLLRDHGHQVVTYTRSNDEIEHYGLTDKLMMFPRTVWSSASRTDFAAVLDRERPDLVHFHNTFIVMSPSVYAACRDRGIPVVQTLHNYRLCCPGGAFYRDGAPCEECTTKGVWNSIAHKCYRNSLAATAAVASMLAVNRSRGTWANAVDAYIALTGFARDKMQSSGIPLHKIHVKPNFLAHDPGVRTEVRDYAIFSGRLVPEKGVQTLVAAWKGLKANLPLRIVGDGPERRSLETICKREHIDNVHFYGLKPRTEAMEQVRSARFVVFPSGSYENFPMAIVEAYAMAVPVIATSIGSTAEIVRDGVTGLTFKPGSAAELQSRVEWATEHPDLLQEMGRRARAEFEMKYSATRNYEMLIRIYQSVLGTMPVAEPLAIPEVA